MAGRAHYGSRDVTTVDYRNYLDQQKEWAESLCQVAKSLEPGPACELAEISAETLRRMIHFTFSPRRAEFIRAADTHLP